MRAAAVEKSEDVDRPSERRRKAKQEAIVDAASELSARDGYEGTSLADVAKAVDLTPKALYYYYDFKRDLLDHVIGRGFAYFRRTPAGSNAREVGWPAARGCPARELARGSDPLGRARRPPAGVVLGNPSAATPAPARGTTVTCSTGSITSSASSMMRRRPELKKAAARALAVTVVDALFGICVDGVLRPRRELENGAGAIAPDRAFFRKLTSTLLRGALSNAAALRRGCGRRC